MDWNAIIRSAYQEYGAVTDFKNFQGNPMPEFDALPPKIQQAWEAAVRAAVQQYEALSALEQQSGQTGQDVINQGMRQVSDLHP